MTYTILMFLTRKDGMTPSQFKHHMETIHVPCESPLQLRAHIHEVAAQRAHAHIETVVQSITGPNFPKKSTRRYVQRNSKDSANLPESDDSNAKWVAPSAWGTTTDIDIDAVFSLDFDDEAACTKFVGIINSEDAQRKLAPDEELCLDRGKLRTVVQGEVNVIER